MKLVRPRTPVPHRWRRRAACVAAGVVPVAAFPQPSWWWLAWGAWVPLTLLVRAAPTRHEGVVRAWWGVGAFQAAVQYWLAPNVGPALIVFAVVLGALWLPWGWAVHRFLRPASAKGAVVALAVIPSAWICAEAARSWQSLGGPWAMLGTTQWLEPAFLASASLGGVWLTGCLIAACNTAVALARDTAAYRPGDTDRNA